MLNIYFHILGNIKKKFWLIISIDPVYGLHGKMINFEIFSYILQNCARMEKKNENFRNFIYIFICVKEKYNWIKLKKFQVENKVSIGNISDFQLIQFGSEIKFKFLIFFYSIFFFFFFHFSFLPLFGSDRIQREICFFCIDTCS